VSTVNAHATSDDAANAMTAGPVTAATDRLASTAAAFDDAGLGHPSLCAGWTRAHVLTHVARNADALTNLLVSARTKRDIPQYPSAEARAAGIEAGVGRSVAEIVDDLRTSAERFAKAIMDMPDDGWERQVRPGVAGAGEPIPVRRVLWNRLREVEIHHVDLDAGYGPADWPDAFVQRALGETLRSFARRDDVPAVTVTVDGRAPERLGAGAGAGPTVTGSAADVLAWLIGRSDGSSLQVAPTGAPPAMPAWL
jgi:maleylpyruvate isomerase